MAIGSAICVRGERCELAMGRVLMSYFASVYVRMITGMKLRDATAGFVCYRRRVLEEINLDRIKFKGMLSR